VSFDKELSDLTFKLSLRPRNERSFVIDEWFQNGIRGAVDEPTVNAYRNTVILTAVLGDQIVTNNFQNISGNNVTAAQSVNESNLNQATNLGGEQIASPATGARDIAATLPEEQRTQLEELIGELESAVALKQKEKADSLLSKIESLAKSFGAAATGVYYACKVYLGAFNG
jgi:hypothetical protein